MARWPSGGLPEHESAPVWNWPSLMSATRDLLAAVEMHLAHALPEDVLREVWAKATAEHPGMYGATLTWRGELLEAMHDARVGLGAPPAESTATGLVLRVRMPGDGEQATGPLVRDLVNGVLRS